MVVSKVEPLEMAKREKRAVGMDGTLKATATEVDSNDMTCHRITGDPIPPTTICTHFPRILRRIRIIITNKKRIANRKRVSEMEQSRGLV
ncbi:hypothetical protein RGQ29_018089 [Quercus rubra]|uniref:Uncharacterized protein n=1 Tax=Quercus rubra TaxID=3512 RepID=A0AAN7J1Q3_QUERU|nr:hypothetical protein RGQ29_018089 [Quercus rubra]